MSFSLTVVCLCICLVVSCCGQNTPETRLYNDIILKNNPYERPVYNKSKTIHVNFDFYLRAVSHFDDSRQQLVCTAYLQLSWSDEFLTWDPDLYNGTTFIRPPSTNVWRPDIVAANTFNKLDLIGGTFVSLLLNSTGKVDWVPGDLFKIPCTVNIQHYPFDSLRCNLELIVWSHQTSEVKLKPANKVAHTSDYKVTGQWTLLSTDVSDNSHIDDGKALSRVVIILSLTRSPTNFVFSFLLPVLILSLLGTFVFLIPSDSGEKLSFAITIPLSYGVYMGFLTTLVPQTSQGISVFVIFLGLTLAMSGLFVILSIFSVRVSRRNPVTHPVGKRSIRFTLWMEALNSCRKPHQVPDLDNIRNNDQPHAEHSKPDSVTWIRVSKAFDMLFFVVFGGPIVITIVSLVIYVSA